MQMGRLAGIALALMGTCVSLQARAVCRVIEPPPESGDPGVVFDPETSALYVIRDEADARKISFVVQPRLWTSAGHAVLIMPVPPSATVERGDRAIFEVLRRMTQRTVHERVIYREDPTLGWQCGDPHYSRASLDLPLAAPLAVLGCADEDVAAVTGAIGDDAGEGASDASTIDARSGAGDDADAGTQELPITDAFDLEVVTSGIGELEASIGALGFGLSSEDRAALEPYDVEGFGFVVVHVHPDDHPPGTLAVLTPIVAQWEAPSVLVPERLQFDPRGGTMVTDLFVVATERADLSDGSAITVFASPVDVPPELATLGMDNGWLTRLTLTRLQHEWKEDPEIIPVAPEPVGAGPIDRTLEVGIAAACCSDNGVPRGGGTMRTFEETRIYLESERPSDDTLFYVAPPPPAELCGASGAGDGSSSSGGWGDDGCGGGMDSGGCDGGGSGSSGCACGKCAVTGGPIGGSEPIIGALLFLISRAARSRRQRASASPTSGDTR